MALAQSAVALKYGFRSGLEEKIADSLTLKGVAFTFEEVKVIYTQPEKQRTYSPDFWLPYKADRSLPQKEQRGFFIETKGRWLTEDRQKHLHIRKSHPSIDIRLLFSYANQRISKQSATTYAVYCDRNKWQYADKSVPNTWLQELGYTIEVK